jgi:hypothetical protein
LNDSSVTRLRFTCKADSFFEVAHHGVPHVNINPTDHRSDPIVVLKLFAPRTYPRVEIIRLSLSVVQRTTRGQSFEDLQFPFL